MKMLLILLLFQASITRGLNKNYEYYGEKLLHKSSQEIAAMFTASPNDKEVDLDFNFDSDEHVNIRRSADIHVPVLRDDPLASNEDNDDRGNDTFMEFEPHFDKSLYDCMLPEGEVKKSSSLAVLSYLTHSNETTPSFNILNDHKKWFSVGEVQKKEENDLVIYGVELLVVQGSNILSSISNDSLYEFVIEATEDDMKTTSTVQVEILSLFPTTIRTVVPTTTAASELPAIEDNVEGSADEVDGSGDDVNGISVTSTFATPLTVVTTPVDVISNDHESHTTVAISLEEQNLVLVEERKEDEEQGSGENFEKNENLLQQSHPQDQPEANPEDDKPLTETIVTKATTPVVEELALHADPVGNDELEIILNGTTNGLYTIQDQEHLSRGDILKDLSLSIRINDEKSLKKVNLFVDRTDVFSIRPHQIPSNSKAYLFINSLAIVGDINVKIMAKDEDTGKSTSRVLTIRRMSSLNKAPKKPKQLGTTVFDVNENVPSGTTIGKIQEGNDMMIISKPSIFALVGSDLLLSCNNELPCLDYELQTVHYVLLQNKNGSLPVHEIVVNVNDVNDHVPQLIVTDDVVRILDNQLIGAFAIEVLDKDTFTHNEVSLEGAASAFLAIEPVGSILYQLKITGNAKTGRHDLQVVLTDGSSRIEKTVRVIVQKANSHAHFRRNRYERLVKMENIEKGAEIIRVELEGVPIDEARFVILKGNPGWLRMDDYGGSIIVLTDEQMTPSAHVTIGAVSRQTGQLLAETVVVLNVIGVPEKEKRNDIFLKSIYEKTMDREQSSELGIEIELGNVNLDNKLSIQKGSIFALDENAQIKNVQIIDFTIQGNKIVLSKEIAKDLRIVRFHVICKDQKATVIFHLNSAEDYALHRSKMANRPVFPSPWSIAENNIPKEVFIPEELPVGHIIFLAPAINPTNGELVSSEIVEGNEDFKLNSDTGAVEIIKRFDYDTMSVQERTKHLKIVGGEIDYQSEFEVIVHINDIDDNPPEIIREGIPNQISLPENLPINTTIAKILVSDPDEISMKHGLDVTLKGERSNLYQATVVNNTIIITVAGLLDREESSSHPLSLSLFDSAGNEDKITVTVLLSDENDNTPHFLHDKYDVQVVENWPKGLVVEQLKAADEDIGPNSELKYSLLESENDYFMLDSNSGEFTINKDLLGIAREEPYIFKAMVMDNGNPPLNSTIQIRVKILENVWPKNEGYIDFIDPPLDLVTSLPENTKLNEVVYHAKAQVRTREIGRQHMLIKYSIMEGNATSEKFKIDESTGEIMLAQPLDYEKSRSHALIIKAEHLLLNSSNTRLWRVQVENVDDNTPVFINSSSLLFTLRSLVPIGRLSAFDADGDAVFYRIIPSCSPYSKYFTIDEEYGEITFNRKEDDIKEHRINLCAIARSQKTLLDPELQFDSRRSDMIQFIVAKEHEQQFIIPDMTSYNNTITTIDPLLQRISIPVNMHSYPSSHGHLKLNSSIIRVQYTPCADMLPATTTKTALNQLFVMDDETNTVRISPKLASEHDGIYKVSIATDSPNETYMINQEYHLINAARKSKYVFDLPASELSRNIRGFQRRLSTALSSDHPDLPMRIVVDKPMSMNNNRTRSFVCFHTVKDGKIVSPEAALDSLSINNVGSVSQLAHLYSKYHIIDIQECDSDPKYVSAASIFSNPSLNMVTILIYLAICSLILLPFAIIIYFCVVRRYRTYISTKEKTLKAPSSDVSQSPSLQPTPTFLLAPSTVTPMGPIGYWD